MSQEFFLLGGVYIPPIRPPDPLAGVLSIIGILLAIGIMLVAVKVRDLGARATEKEDRKP